MLPCFPELNCSRRTVTALHLVGMNPSSRHFRLVFLLQLLLAACFVESRKFTAPGKQVLPLQWRFFTSNLPWDWRGLWIRYYANGSIHTETNSTRKFEIPPGESKTDPQSFIQTNTYSNPNWHTNGETVRQFFGKNGNPPIYAQRILPNGTRVPPLGPGILFFMNRDDYLFVPTVYTEISQLFIFEKFLTHPRDRTIRFSIGPVYRNLQLSYISFAREVDGVRFYPTKFWSNSRTARPRRQLPVVQEPRFWQVSSKCISKDYVLRTTGPRRVTTGWTVHLQPRERMSILELPDNVTLYYPTNLADYNRRTLSFMILWNIDKRTALKSVVSLDLEGNFSETCTSTYMKMN